MKQGPRIYNLFPLLVGPIDAWKSHLSRIADMGFDWLFLNPFHEPGFSGSLYAVKDYYRLHPIFRGNSGKDDAALLAGFVEAADAHGLSVMMDLVINHTAKDSVLVDEKRHWFAHNPDGSLRSPGAVDPTDPTLFTEWGDLAEINYAERPERDEIVAYWQALVRHYLGLGFRGFRGDAAYKVPAAVWRDIIADARRQRAHATFFAETLGCRPNEVEALHEAGFDYIFNSSKWWDFKAPWLLEQYELFRRIAPSISFPESHDTERLIADLEREGIEDRAQIEAIYRQRYLFSTVFSTGVMIPSGYEFGFRRRADVVRSRPEDWEDALFDISEFIAEANRMKATLPVLNEEGPQSQQDTSDAHVIALCRRAADADWTLTVINGDRARDHTVAADLLIKQANPGIGKEVTPGHHHARLRSGTNLRLHPSEIRVFVNERQTEANRRQKETAAKSGEADTTARSRAKPEADGVRLHSRPLIIQHIYPEIDCGRYPVKREVGDLFEVWADIFKEGHDKIAAVLKYKRQGEEIWHEQPMQLIEPGLDRWRGVVRLEENARYLYTIEAWPDAYETWLDEVEKKRRAGQNIALELLEGRALADAARGRAAAQDKKRLETLLTDFDRAEDGESRLLLLASAQTRRLMKRLPDRTRAAVYDRELEITVDRRTARYAAWYEMFPRSQGHDPNRSATFRDCIARLDEVQRMGFDVVYFVPIHPIGRTHRKGRNNTLNAGEHDPGSPYAIGSEKGGHDAVDPDLGTLADFRAFVAAARERGMEVALDFAIQCSPDHPWLKTHPEWFDYRPDGTIKYAENPPKKYQDIVNVNFYGGHQDELWRTLRDVVLFWVVQGVRIFRVDNPHTKPVPFWEWLIRTVQRSHPDVVFLSEAFTRPPMLRMLAKAGFSQSYTYFTWRNFKGELIDYFTELCQSESAEYLRPNLFANTPDILPQFLQAGGRPAFQIRLVLAATLSSVYGIYNSFELCEGRAVPGTEEYLESEKYQYKVWDWDRPGNIKDYIAAINRIRRENPALHHFRNLRFYEASDGNVLFYGKIAPGRDNMVFIAVNLDPFEAHESELRFPLGEIGIVEGDTFRVEELLSGDQHLWSGASQRVRLDPHNNPAAVFRVSPWERVDFHNPCF